MSVSAMESGTLLSCQLQLKQAREAALPADCNRDAALAASGDDRGKDQLELNCALPPLGHFVTNI